MKKLVLVLAALLLLGLGSFAVAAVCSDSGGARSCGMTCNLDGGNCSCIGLCSEKEYQLVLQ